MANIAATAIATFKTLFPPDSCVPCEESLPVGNGVVDAEGFVVDAVGLEGWVGTTGEISVIISPQAVQV